MTGVAHPGGSDLAVAAGAPAPAVVARLRQAALDTLRPVLAGAGRFALLDFPDHANVGDSAIWLGELAALRALSLPPPAYTCTVASYSPGALAAAGVGTILFHGGGNLGDLWPRHQEFRERVLADFPGTPAVLLPQSVEFSDRRALERTRERFHAHGRVTALGRSHRSVTWIRDELGLPGLLCPDLAFCLGTRRRIGAPRTPVLWLRRNDLERRDDDGAANPELVEIADWVAEPGHPAHHAALAAFRGLNHAGRSRRWEPVIGRLARTVAERRVRAGFALVGRGRAVLTDRLHGHILCLMAGIPHCLLDNSYGKLRAFYETWTIGTRGAVFAESAAEGVRIAGELAAST